VNVNEDPDYDHVSSSNTAVDPPGLGTSLVELSTNHSTTAHSNRGQNSRLIGYYNNFRFLIR